MFPADFAQRLSLMGLGVVQKCDHRTSQVPEQMAEEYTYLLLPDVLEVELVIQTQAVPSRAYRDCRNDRDLVPPIAMAMHRSLAPRCPSLDDIRDQQESGFVNEDDVGTQPRSVFFTRGQSFRFQRSMASSSRSAARVSGF